MRRLLPAVAGPTAFGLASVLGARRVRGYRHRDEPMSALAAQRCAGSPFMIPGFLALGGSTWSLARALDGTSLPPSVPRMMRLAGVSTVLAGLARQSDRSCPVRFMGDDNVKLTDDLHVLFSVPVFTLWIAMPFVTAARGRGLRPVDRRRSLALGLAALAGQMWTSALIRKQSETWGGAAQRFTVASALAWYPVAAIAASS
jgi:hypothetical protein